MSSSYIDLNIDQAIKVRINMVHGNSLPLDFKFYDKNGDPYTVTGIAFVFTVSDEQLKSQKYQIVNSQWTRPAQNQITFTVNPFPLAVGTYKFDFTATLNTGVIQTLMDGEMVIRERYKKM